MKANYLTARRYELTMAFLKECVPGGGRVLDLGTDNPFAEQMRQAGYQVFNTEGDLDLNPEVVRRIDVDVVTAFEILEHLVSPFSVLSRIGADRLVVTVPLRLWFAKAYRNEADQWDRHFHEFEDWQFDWLLEKAGWKIERTAKWTSPTREVGVRPILRRLTPRYYAVEAVRK